LGLLCQGKLLRRLKYIVQEGDGVLRRTDPKGSPLKIPTTGVESPIVIDLHGIHSTPSLQRFVVAAVFHQIQQAQSAKQVPNLKYLLTLDELNRFAPKDSSDPITQKLETVASEVRSQGIILLGAQQQASLVKPRVIENAAIRAVGRSGTLELGTEVWKFLGPSARSAASQLQPDEKLLYQPSFREPMLAKIPFSPFALSENDAAAPPPIDGAIIGSASSADLDAFRFFLSHSTDFFQDISICSYRRSPMRLIHTADWLLCDRLGRIDRTKDLETRVERVAALCSCRGNCPSYSVAAGWRDEPRRDRPPAPQAIPTTPRPPMVRQFSRGYGPERFRSPAGVRDDGSRLLDREADG
jgi:hypothetical protein